MDFFSNPQLDDIDVQYQPPQDHQFQINFEELSANAVVKDTPKGGFQVRGGPWEKKNNNKQQNVQSNQHQQQQPNFDSSSAQDFPAFGGGPGSGAPGINGNGLSDGGDAVPVTLNGGLAWGPRKNWGLFPPMIFFLPHTHYLPQDQVTKSLYQYQCPYYQAV